MAKNAYRAKSTLIKYLNRINDRLLDESFGSLQTDDIVPSHVRILQINVLLR